MSRAVIATTRSPYKLLMHIGGTIPYLSIAAGEPSRLRCNVQGGLHIPVRCEDSPAPGCGRRRPESWEPVRLVYKTPVDTRHELGAEAVLPTLARTPLFEHIGGHELL
jgi:hypothetical protein